MQKSVACALATQTAKLATNKHANLAGLPPKRVSAGMASPDRTPRQRFKHTIYIQINSGLTGKGNQPNLAIPAKAGTYRSAAAALAAVALSWQNVGGSSDGNMDPGFPPG
jgi:hypothetical protein